MISNLQAFRISNFFLQKRKPSKYGNTINHKITSSEQIRHLFIVDIFLN